MATALKTKAHFVESYSEYYQLLFNVIYSKVHDEDAAADIAQEVFVRYFEHIDEVRDTRKWLFGTMRNVIFEYIRKSREMAVDPETLFNDVSMSFVNGFRDSRIIIEQALEDMKFYNSDKERVLFDLIALYNYSYRDAARQLGLSERQAKYRYYQVVGKLMDYFKARGIKGLEDLL